MATIFSKIIKGVLIGGGTVLSSVCPPAGGAIISAGMAIGAGAIAAGSLIGSKSANSSSTVPTIDSVTARLNTALGNAGLLNPVDYATTGGNKSAFILTTPIILIAGAIGLFLILKRRR